ncbi:MAG TPA: ubiquitin-like domain-containing protein [Jatrophihabitans sp.]
MRRSVKYGLCGGVAGVVAAVVAGTTAMASASPKLVTVNVDGNPIAVKTSAHDVGDVLEQIGYAVQSHDLVAPTANAAVKSGAVIVLKRGRELHLQVNGTSRTVWTTAATVDEALDQLGYSEKDYTSVSRANRLAVGSTTIAVRTPKSVVLTADGDKKDVTTTASTVGDVLSELGITIAKKDVVTPALATDVTDKTRITVTRVKKGRITVAEDVPFDVTQQPSTKLTVGQTTIVTAGVPGTAHVIYAVTYHNGKIAKRTEVKRTVTAQPVAQVEKVGTMPVPVVKAAGAAAPSSAPAAASAPVAPSSIATPAEAQNIAWKIIQSRGWGRNQFNCLAQLWGHESGWRVAAGNAYGTYGIPQANPGSKMSSAGPNWQTDAKTQIIWGLGYITAKYGTPCGAWNLWQSQGWY